MIRIGSISDLELCFNFINKHHQSDELYSAFMSKNEVTLKQDIKKALSLNTALIYDCEEAFGVLVWHVQVGAKMLDIAGPYTKHLHVAEELIKKLVSLYDTPYKLNFFVRSSSNYYKNLFQTTNATFLGYEVVMEVDKVSFNPTDNLPLIQELKDVHKNEVKKIHDDTFKDIYITSDELISDTVNGKVFVYEEDYVIGYALIKNNQFVFMVEIYAIEKNKRGQGYGKRFLSAIVKELFKNDACKSIRLVVEVTNTTALNLYHNIGFKIIENNSTYFISLL